MPNDSVMGSVVFQSAGNTASGSYMSPNSSIAVSNTENCVYPSPYITGTTYAWSSNYDVVQALGRVEGKLDKLIELLTPEDRTGDDDELRRLNARIAEILDGRANG